MIKRYGEFLKEEYLEGDFQDASGSNFKVYELLFYAFDWDDNILKMPTEIFLVDINGEEVGMSTQDFAEYRTFIGKEEFDYNGKTIVGYAIDPFRYFRDEVDPEIFVKDVEKAVDNKMFAKSYDKFIECLTTGSLFAIITARGHESGPDNNSGPMRRGIEMMIQRLNSSQKSSMINHLKLFAHLYDQPITSEFDLISNYLDHCEFIGVSAPSRGGTPDNPELAKEVAFKNFVKKCDDIARDLEIKFNEDIETQKRGENWRVIAKVGFSDDDSKNYEHIDDVAKNLHNETYTNVKEFHIIYSGEEETKNVYLKYDKPSLKKDESKINNFKGFVKVIETSHQTPGLENSVLPFTQFGNMSGRLNPSSAMNRQDDFYNQFRRQVDYLAKTSKEVTKDMKKRKKSSK